jgi:predicted nucleic acid-binding protein
MNLIFADTSYYVALLLENDQDHERAVEITRTLHNPIVTTAWVITEIANGLSAVRHRQTVVRLIERLNADKSVRVAPPDPSTFEAGLELYRNSTDKDWSLTDCISFVVMSREKMTDALTADHNFEQAGFRALMR